MKLQIGLNEKLALSIPEACAMGGVQKDSLYREINSGHLKSAKINGRRVIRREALEQWLADRESTTNEAMGFGEAAK